MKLTPYLRYETKSVPGTPGCVFFLLSTSLTTITRTSISLGMLKMAKGTCGAGFHPGCRRVKINYTHTCSPGGFVGLLRTWHQFQYDG